MRSHNYSSDEYQRQEAERSQREVTRRRRDGRSRRKRGLILAGLAFFLVVIGALPSLVTHSPIASSVLSSTMKGFGLEASADSIRVGWMTPLRVEGLRISGQSEISIDQLDAPLTVTDLMGAMPQDLGEIVIRGLNLQCSVSRGDSSLEQDFSAFLQPDSGGETVSGSLQLHDVSVEVTDRVTAQTWKLSQSTARIDLQPEQITASVSGMMTEPSQHSGSLQSELTLSTDQSDAWEVSCVADSLPLSGIALVRRRFPDLESMPQSISGDATGGVLLSGRPGGGVEATLTEVEIRNLTAAAADGNALPWQNHLASVRGHLIADADRIIGKNVEATTDFASATFDGSIPSQLSWTGSSDNFLKWLDNIDGEITGRIDLARLDSSLPGVLPMRKAATLQSGTVTAVIRSLPGREAFRSQMTLRSDPIRARAGERQVVIDPIEADAVVSNQAGVLAAEKFEWKSAFGNAVGSGNLKNGNARIQVDFNRLMSMLRPLLNVSDVAVAGIIDGDVNWNAESPRGWELVGNANATNLQLDLPAERRIQRSNMSGRLQINGRWSDDRLAEISAAKLQMDSPGLTVQAELQKPVQLRGTVATLPVVFTSRGQAATAREIVLPWLPAEFSLAEGRFEFNGESEWVFADNEIAVVRLSGATVEVSDPVLHYNGNQFTQNRIIADFVGDLAWPNHTLRSEKLTISGDAITLAAKGEASSESVTMEIAFRTDLNRLQNSILALPATPGGMRNQTVSYRYRPPSESLDAQVHGNAEGQVWVTGPAELLAVRTAVDVTDVAIDRPGQTQALSGPSLRPGSTRREVLWSEPRVRLESELRVNSQSGQTTARSLELTTDWLAANLAGNLQWVPTGIDLDLDGQAKMRMERVAEQLAALSSSDIRAVGDHETPIRLRVGMTEQGAPQFVVSGKLGWSEAEVGGIRVGPSMIPFTMDEHTISIRRSGLPVGGGMVYPEADIHYGASPRWIRVPSGRIAESVNLTPEMTRKWLKFVAPIAADATEVQGRFSLDLEESMVVIDSPDQTRVRGQLEIDNARIAAGPLANQVIGGIRQIKSLAAVGNTRPSNSAPVTFVDLRPQSVEFSLVNQVVRHQRLFFEVDRAEVVTSGSVGLDGRLALSAQIPLNAGWLGSDLKSIAGQQVIIPVSGTFARPQIDSSAIRNTLARAGQAAVESAVESTVQRSIDGIFKNQLDKGQRELNRGLQNLGLEKLFGN